MAEKNKKSKPGALSPDKKKKPEDKIKAARKTLLDMREKLLGEGLGKSCPEDLARTFEIGEEGDHADAEQTHGVSVLLSVRDKEKLRAIDGALDKIQDGTYGECEECGDEIGAGRLKAMPLAKFCVSCQSQVEKEQASQKFVEERLNQPRIVQEKEDQTD